MAGEFTPVYLLLMLTHDSDSEVMRRKKVINIGLKSLVVKVS